MPYQRYPDGLYLLRKQSAEKGVDHYGILDIGNRAGLLQLDQGHPIVIHQTPPAIRVDWLQDTGTWEAIAKIVDEDAAIVRMNQAFRNPNYALFGHNCEQFARYVALGRWESTQLQAAGFIAGLAALAFVALQDNRKPASAKRRRSAARRTASYGTHAQTSGR